MSGCDEDVKIPGNGGPAGWRWESDTMTHGQTPPSPSCQVFFSLNVAKTNTNKDDDKQMKINT